jgi:hypothetical protein
MCSPSGRETAAGTFMHHLLVNGLLPSTITSASQAPPLFTSKCVHAKLQRLGKSHSEAFDAAQLLATARSPSILLFILFTVLKLYEISLVNDEIPNMNYFVLSYYFANTVNLAFELS